MADVGFLTTSEKLRMADQLIASLAVDDDPEWSLETGAALGDAFRAWERFVDRLPDGLLDSGP